MKRKLKRKICCQEINLYFNLKKVTNNDCYQVYIGICCDQVVWPVVFVEPLEPQKMPDVEDEHLSDDENLQTGKKNLLVSNFAARCRLKPHFNLLTLNNFFSWLTNASKQAIPENDT